ncbi:MAG: hypothetical protein H7Z41_17455 [Cytophagales bacterium]|nr:hypothetical protein [Armatimonadota bacterium]
MTSKIRSVFAAAVATAALAALTAGTAAPVHADLTGPKAPPPPPSQSK